jgi:uncharacterized SAM-binding protein YcdF (DUF218 family)
MARMGPRGVREETTPSQVKAVPRRRRLGRLLLLAAAVAALLLYFGRYPILRAAGSFLDVSEPAVATDYVMVLGGNLQTRPFAAAALVNAGLARKAIVATIAESGDTLDGIVPSEQEMIRALLVHQGVSPDAVLILPNLCASTFDEANALTEFLKSRPDSSVTVVTSAQHTRRTRWIFRKALGEHSAQVHFAGAPLDGFDATNWWRFESGFCTYVDEYLKLAFYLMRY